MENIFFSVLIPVYNVEKYIAECVESVIQQSYSNFEIILVNDGSTDSSGELCEEFAKKDKRIKVYHKKNEGLMMTRRYGIQKASGDYILFLDSDDYWDKALLKIVYSAINKHHCDLVIYNYYRNNGNTFTKNKAVFLHESVFDSTNKLALITEGVCRNHLNSMWIKAVKRTLIMEDKTPYENYQSVIVSSEDIFQSIPLFFLAEKIVYLDIPLVFYRLIPTSITATYNQKKFEVVQTIFNRKMEYIKTYGVDEEYLISEIKRTALWTIVHLLFKNVASAKIDKREKIKVLRSLRTSKFIETIITDINYENFPLIRKLFINNWIDENYQVSLKYLQSYALAQKYYKKWKN